MKLYLVVGHYTATDGDVDPSVNGKLDENIQVVLCRSRGEVEETLLWYQDGIVKEIRIESV